MTATGKYSYIECAAISDPGTVRRNNEDAYACLAPDGCFLVSDGMGGASAGEVASRIVEEHLSAAVTGSAEDSPGSRKYAVQQAVHRANRTIREYAREHFYAQMGATLALLLADSWDPGKAWVCHVGDSRIYRLRRGELQRLTRDHTVGAELSERSSGKIFSDRARSPISHMLTRSIGVSVNVLPEWKDLDVRAGDLFMLCSDGVSTMIDEEEIRKRLSAPDSLDGKIAALSERIREAGAKDNFTIVLCGIAPTLPDAAEHEDGERRENDYLLRIAEERIDHA